MPWHVSYRQDTEIKNTGTLSASFVDDGGASIVTYGRRCNTDDGDDLMAFIAEAEAELQKAQESIADNQAVLDKVTAILNGG